MSVPEVSLVGCANCGRQNESTARFCRGCGTPQTPMASQLVQPLDPWGSQSAALTTVRPESVPPMAEMQVAPPTLAARLQARGLPPWAMAAGALAVVLLVGGMVFLLQSRDNAPVGSAPSAQWSPAVSTADPQETEQVEPDVSACNVDLAYVTASSTAEPGVDSAGDRVTYAATNLLDGDSATAWRTPGRGIGETITFEFEGPCRLTAIYVLNGYHKTDSEDGSDRWTQNRRVSSFLVHAGESTYFAELDADSRDWQSLELDGLPVESVTLKIDGSEPSEPERDYTAISEISFS